MSTKRSRTWTFTVNNPTVEDRLQVATLIKSEPTYIVVGKETGAEGTPHLQGYIRFKTVKSLTQVKTLLSRAHLEPAKGTDKQNRVYCTKDGDFIEQGIVGKQGKRTDIEMTRKVVAANPEGPMRALFKENVNYQCVRLTEKYLTYCEKQRNWFPEISWYWGPSGTGKTRLAFEELDDPYVCNDEGKWWDGYDAHPNVIVDDFRADFCKFRVLLRMLDGYTARVEFKGGFRQLLFKKMIITCPYHPSVVYKKNDEEIYQLTRRITNIVYFPEKKILGDSIKECQEVED